MPAKPRTARLAGTAAAALAWYDLILFAAAAVLVFDDVFFPSLSGASPVALAGVYALGLVACPLGAALFGYRGDRTTTADALSLALITSGVATFLIGLVPAHATIGAGAPVLLALLRLAQGIALGGLWGGLVCLHDSLGPRGGRGRSTSWVQIGLPSGTLLALGLTTATKLLLPDSYDVWAWRLPFLLSAAPALLGIWLRYALRDGGRPHPPRAFNPVAAVWRTGRRASLSAFLARLGADTAFGVFVVYLLFHLESRALAIAAVLTGAAFQIVAVPVLGRLSDRVGPGKVVLAGAAAVAAWSWAFFPLTDLGRVDATVAATVVALLAHAAVHAPLAGFTLSLFPERLRYTGTSLGYQSAGFVAFALAPAAAIGLIPLDTGPTVLSGVITGALALTAVGVAAAPRRTEAIALPGPRGGADDSAAARR
ncbi:MFS transporter [Salininema proteolyticum]|uniref:MFS transporter n=1 Tax=Salininema proteolyticum TaxID=1607685 RepID=A0ABV8TZX0_9ACTN